VATVDVARRTGGWLGGLALVVTGGLVVAGLGWAGVSMLNALFGTGSYDRSDDRTVVQIGEVASRLDYEIDGLVCSVADGQARARGSIVNSRAVDQAFGVTVTFRDGAGLDVDRRIDLEPIPAAGRRAFQARTFRNEPVAADATCSVDLVHRAHLEVLPGNYD
jgi:hypothetical protein